MCRKTEHLTCSLYSTWTFFIMRQCFCRIEMAWANGIPEANTWKRTPINRNQDKMQIAGKSTFKHSGESLFIGMYKIRGTQRNQSREWTHLRRIPIAHFQVISQGPPPDPALASSWGQLTSLRHNGIPWEGPFSPRPSPSLYCSSRQQYFSDGRINSYLCLCSLLGPPDSWTWASNGVSI